MIKESKQKLAEKGITWKEEYTDKTQFLKDQFEDTVGPGSYFRFEGKSPDGDEYYCIIGPAGIHKPKAKFFAGVRKLPATFSAGGKYFDSLDTAARYARETWGIKTPKSLKPYTQKQLFGIAKKVKKWKEEREEEREESQSENEDKNNNKKEASVLNKFDKKYSLNFPITGLNKAIGFPIEFLDKKAMPLDKYRINRTNYFFTTFEDVMSGNSEIFELLRHDNPSFESALTLIQNEKIKRTCIYMRKYNVKEEQVRNFFRVYVGWCKRSGLSAEFIGPYLMDPKEYFGLDEAVKVYCEIFGLQNTFDVNVGNLFDEQNKAIAIDIINKKASEFISTYKQYVLKSNKNEETALKEHFKRVSRAQVMVYETKRNKLKKYPDLNIFKLFRRIKKVTSSFYTECRSSFNTFTMAFSIPDKTRVQKEIFNIKGEPGTDTSQRTRKKPSFPELSMYDQSIDENGNIVISEVITKDQQAEYIAEHGIPRLSRIGEPHFSYRFSLSEGFKKPRGEGQSPGFFQARSISKGTEQSLICTDMRNRVFKKSSGETSPYLTPAHSPERYIYSLSGMSDAIGDNMVASNNVNVILNNDGFATILLNMFAKYPQLNGEILKALNLTFLGSEDGRYTESSMNQVDNNYRFEKNARESLKEIFSSLPNLIYFLTGINPGENNPDSPHAITDSFKETVVRGLSNTKPITQARQGTGDSSISPVLDSGVLNLNNTIRRPGGQNPYKESGSGLFRVIIQAIINGYKKLIESGLPDDITNYDDIKFYLNILENAKSEKKTKAIFSGRTSTLTPDAALNKRMELINEVAKGMKSGGLEHFSKNSVNYIVDYLNKCQGTDPTDFSVDQKKRIQIQPFNVENCQFLVFQFLEEKIISEIIKVLVEENIKKDEITNFLLKEKDKIANILVRNGHDLIQPNDLDNLLLLCIERVGYSKSEEIKAITVTIEDLVSNTSDLLSITRSKAKSGQGDGEEKTSTNVRYDSDTAQFVQYGYHSSLIGSLSKLREKFFIMSQESSTKITRDPVTKTRLVSMIDYLKKSGDNNGSRIFSRLPNAKGLDYQYNADHLQELHGQLGEDELYRYRKYRNDIYMQKILQEVEPKIETINKQMYESQSGDEGIISKEDSEPSLELLEDLLESSESEKTEEKTEVNGNGLSKDIRSIISRHIGEVRGKEDWELVNIISDFFADLVGFVRQYPIENINQNKTLNPEVFNGIMEKLLIGEKITADDKENITSPDKQRLPEHLYGMFLKSRSEPSTKQEVETQEPSEESPSEESPLDVDTDDSVDPFENDFELEDGSRKAKNNIIKGLIKMSRELDNEGKYKSSSELLKLAKRFLK